MKTTPKFSLRDRAMLVSLHLSKWSGQKLDRPTTEEVLRDKGAAADGGRFEKYLVPKAALADVAAAHNRARSEFRRLTLPWDEGVGIVAAERWEELQGRLSDLKRECSDEADKFARQYPTLRAGARARLNGLYAEGDFPDVDTIRDRFDFRVIVLPVPAAEDFRVDLGAAAVTEIRRGIEQMVNEKAQAAQRDLWQRVLDVVKHFATTMAGDTSFKNSTVNKLVEIATEAPRLTLAPDAQLDATCAEIRKFAGTFTADGLRDDAGRREKAAKDAAAAVARIEKRMQGAF